MGGLNRQRPFQRFPDEHADYRRFPRRTCTAGSQWFRQHAVGLTPWWFSSSGEGRFDLDPPRGTCYLAATPAAALRERLGPDLALHGKVAASVVDGRVISALKLPNTVKAADLGADRASDVYGVTGELTVLTPYRLTRAWARVLSRAGFGGICGRLRFSLGGDSTGLGVFGDAGNREDWPGDDDPATARMVAEAMGVTVVDPPDDEEITYA